MANVETKKASDIGFLKHAARILATATLSPTILRSEVTDDNHSIDKAKEVLKSGTGLIVVINHFSLKDPPQATNEVFHHTVMRNKKVIAPIAYHMDRSLYHWFGKLLGYKLVPIVTENTVREGKNNGRKLNDGRKEYLDESIKLLKAGGIVILAPQGARMSHLVQPDSPAVGTLMLEAKRNRLDNYAFLFIGIGIKSVDDYLDKKVRGFNPLKKYTVNIGVCLTHEEILARAENNYRTVDKVIFEELRRVVPSNYR